MRECVAADLMWPKQIGINEMEIGQERPKLSNIFLECKIKFVAEMCCL